MINLCLRFLGMFSFFFWFVQILDCGDTHLTEDTVPVVMESVLEKLDFR